MWMQTQASACANIAGWRGFNNPWMPEDDGDLEFAYINLLKNPERYTGYKGALLHGTKNANRLFIW